MIQHTCWWICKKTVFISCILFTIFFLSSCKSVVPEKKETIFRCERDQSLIYDSIDGFCKCVGIESAELQSYAVLKTDEHLDSFSSPVPTERMREILMQRLVTEIKKELYRAFSEYAPEPWATEKILVPVKFALFVKRGATLEVRAVLLYKKDDIGAERVLKYLPLEYKQFYLEKMKIRLDANFR